jgi:predicted metal-binding protein
MMRNLDDLVALALELKADHAAIVDTTGITFHEEFRKACERNACGRYGTNWMGPPAIGPINELSERVKKYRHGLLFQTVHSVASSFDMKGMMAGAKVHEQIFRNLLAEVRTKFRFKSVLPLDAGCCRLCEKCAYLDQEPCRNPDQAVASVEAYGMDVMALVKEVGIPYNNGKNTVSYVGLILFEEDQ